MRLTDRKLSVCGGSPVASFKRTVVNVGNDVLADPLREVFGPFGAANQAVLRMRRETHEGIMAVWDCKPLRHPSLRSRCCAGAANRS